MAGWIGVLAGSRNARLVRPPGLDRPNGWGGAGARPPALDGAVPCSARDRTRSDGLCGARRALTSRAINALVLAIVAASGGCAYARARASDASQIFRVDVGAGFGICADVRLLGLLDFGTGMPLFLVVPMPGASFTWNAALLYGDPWVGIEEEFMFPGWCRRDYSPVRSANPFVTLSREHWSHACHSIVPAFLNWNEPKTPEIARLDRGIHRFDLEAGATAVMVRLRLGFSPGELLDFLLGWFGLDFAEDDGPAPPPPPSPKPSRPQPEPPKPEPPPLESLSPEQAPPEPEPAAPEHFEPRAPDALERAVGRR